MGMNGRPRQVYLRLENVIKDRAEQLVSRMLPFLMFA